LENFLEEEKGRGLEVYGELAWGYWVTGFQGRVSHANEECQGDYIFCETYIFCFVSSSGLGCSLVFCLSGSKSFVNDNFKKLII
jgi:hypothetical protein